MTVCDIHGPGRAICAECANCELDTAKEQIERLSDQLAEAQKNLETEQELHVGARKTIHWHLDRHGEQEREIATLHARNAELRVQLEAEKHARALAEPPTGEQA